MSMISTRDGTKLYFKDWGEGRPVILVHGWPLSSDTWDPVAMHLANSGFRAIAYDRRGFGRSDQPWGGYDYDTMSDDLADVMQATGAKDATIVGFSMGGGEIARYMGRHDGKHVRQAVLISSVVPFMLQTDDHDGVPNDVFEDIKAGINKDWPDFMKGFLRDFYGVTDAKQAVSEAYLHWSWRQTMMASLKATLDCVDAFGKTDFRGDLPAFNVPTLIIHGTDDQTVPIDVSGRAAAKGIDGAKLLEYEGSPHGVFATDTDRLKDDLLSFVRG